MAQDASNPPIVHAIPLDAISADAMTRDRTSHDPDAFFSLKDSITLEGVRSPIEVYREPAHPDAPDAPPRYGLIAGYRRLAAVRALQNAGEPGFDTIPAFIRPIADEADAYRLMVEENLLRADVSPWERAALIARAVEGGLFATLDAATNALFRSLHRNKRRNLRTIAALVIELGDVLMEPQHLSERQLLALAAATQAGFGDAIGLALDSHKHGGIGAQWEAIQPFLTEHAAEKAHPPKRPRAPGRPRRAIRLSRRLAVRRETTPEGYVLRFSGPDALCPLLDRVLDDLEILYRAG